MRFDLVAAVLAGLIAGPVMEIPAYAQRALGLGVHQDIFAEGWAILRARGHGQRFVGYLGHAVFSALIAALYVAFFSASRTEQHLLGWGLFGGLVHFAIGGLVVGTFRHLHPQMPERLPPPGIFYRHYGRRDVLTFLGGHLIFGALVGALRRAAPQWRTHSHCLTITARLRRLPAAKVHQVRPGGAP